MRFVLDTNVVVSGLTWDGPPRRPIDLAASGAVALFSSTGPAGGTRGCIGAPEARRVVGIAGPHHVLPDATLRRGHDVGRDQGRRHHRPLPAPGHAAVLCIDEKTPIQALDLRDRVLPLSPRRVERHGFEYKRHGTLSLYATLVVQTDEVRGRPRPGTRASTSWASWVKWSRPAPATRRFT